MYSSVLSGVLYGLKAEIVRVEVDVGNGIPSFEMSGFLSNEVKEARERVRVAIHYLRRPGDCFCDHDADTGGQPDNYSDRTAVPVYDGGN